MKTEKKIINREFTRTECLNTNQTEKNLNFTNQKVYDKVRKNYIAHNTYIEFFNIYIHSIFYRFDIKYIMIYTALKHILLLFDFSDGQTDEQTDGKQTDGRMDRRTDVQADRQTFRRTDRYMECRTYGQTDE